MKKGMRSVSLEKLACLSRLQRDARDRRKKKNRVCLQLLSMGIEKHQGSLSGRRGFRRFGDARLYRHGFGIEREELPASQSQPLHCLLCV